jgi:hypothetical protein
VQWKLASYMTAILKWRIYWLIWLKEGSLTQHTGLPTIFIVPVFGGWTRLGASSATTPSGKDGVALVMQPATACGDCIIMGWNGHTSTKLNNRE